MALEPVCYFFAVAFPVLIALFNGYHKIQEGHVGIYFRGGALLDYISEPGIHFKFPVITSVENVQVTV